MELIFGINIRIILDWIDSTLYYGWIGNWYGRPAAVRDGKFGIQEGIYEFGRIVFVWCGYAVIDRIEAHYSLFSFNSTIMTSWSLFHQFWPYQISCQSPTETQLQALLPNFWHMAKFQQTDTYHFLNWIHFLYFFFLVPDYMFRMWLSKIYTFSTFYPYLMLSWPDYCIFMVDSYHSCSFILGSLRILMSNWGRRSLCDWILLKVVALM